MNKPKHSENNPKEEGFALVLSLALLSFLALLILALIALIGVEARVAEATKTQQLARAHAKIAMWIALGELKEHVGPDKRIPARADFQETNPASPAMAGGPRYWPGVWNSADPTEAPVWLVSGDFPDPQEKFSSATTVAPLVGGTGDSSVDDRVMVPSVTVNSGSSSRDKTGRYAYWIGDLSLIHI